MLAQDKIIGWFQGRMEFGPRALGARSILASPLSPDMQQRLNEIKDREDFRPVAPVVLEEDAPEWFVNGRLKKHSGSQSPTVDYTYDSQGRMKSMTTTGQAGPAPAATQSSALSTQH